MPPKRKPLTLEGWKPLVRTTGDEGRKEERRKKEMKVLEFLEKYQDTCKVNVTAYDIPLDKFITIPIEECELVCHSNLLYWLRKKTILSDGEVTIWSCRILPFGLEKDDSDGKEEKKKGEE